MSGWNGSDRRGGSAPQKPKVTAKKPSPVRGLIAGVVFCIVAGVVLLVLMKDKHPENVRKASPKPPAAKVKLPSYRQVLTNDEETIVLPNGIVTNKPKTIAEAIKMVRLKPGFHVYNSVDEVFSKTNYFQIGEYKTLKLKSSTEAHLSLIARRRRDQLIPPMPPMPDAMARDYQKALENYLNVEEGDSAADAKTKKRIEMMKDMMRHYVKDEGMTPAQAMHAIERDHNRSANLYQLYRGEYVKMLGRDDPDAGAFYDRAIEELGKKGAPKFDRDAKYIDED